MSTQDIVQTIFQGLGVVALCAIAINLEVIGRKIRSIEGHASQAKDALQTMAIPAKEWAEHCSRLHDKARGMDYRNSAFGKAVQKLFTPGPFWAWFSASQTTTRKRS